MGIKSMTEIFEILKDAADAADISHALVQQLLLEAYDIGKHKPEQEITQYLLDQVAKITAENAMLKEKAFGQSEKAPSVKWIEPIDEGVKDVYRKFEWQPEQHKTNIVDPYAEFRRNYPFQNEQKLGCEE